MQNASSVNGVGVRLIVAYKLGKAVLELVLGVVLVALSRSVTKELHVVVEILREHAVAAWSVMLADRLVGLATRGHVVLVGAASLFDAVVSFVEGWSLHRRYWWSRWLVVVATGSLVPFEIASLVRHFTLGRAILLVVNVWIVIYLVRHRLSSYAARATADQSTSARPSAIAATKR